MIFVNSFKRCFLPILLILLSGCNKVQPVPGGDGWSIVFLPQDCSEIHSSIINDKGDVRFRLTVDDIPDDIFNTQKVDETMFLCESDKEIEANLLDFLDPDHTSVKSSSNLQFVGYRKELVADIKVTAFYSDDQVDITDKLAFCSDRFLMVGKDKHVWGYSKDGMHLREYIDMHMHMFPYAYLAIPQDIYAGMTGLNTIVSFESGKTLSRTITVQ